MIDIQSAIKNLFYIPVFLVGCGIPENFADTTTILAILMIIDMVTGILASVRVDGKQSVKSKVGIIGLSTKGVIILIPLVVALIAKGLGINMIFLISGVFWSLILYEGYSILGNIETIRSGVRLPEYDAVANLIKVMRKIFMKLMEKGEIK